MRLVPNWGRILRRAWSIRLMLVAGVLTGLEAILQFLDLSFMPVWASTLLTFATVVSAFVARIVAQESIHEDL